MQERSRVVGRRENIRKEGKQRLANTVFNDGTELGVQEGGHFASAALYAKEVMRTDGEIYMYHREAPNSAAQSQASTNSFWYSPFGVKGSGR